MSEHKISHKWQLVLAFFLGGSISSLAQDPSDTAFFYAQSHGLTSASQTTVFWYWVPFALYLSLFGLGWVLAKSGRVKPVFLIYLYMALVLFSAVASLTLPQTTSNVYLGSVFLGTAVSFGVLLGLRKHVQ